MTKAKIRITYQPCKTFQKYGLESEVEINFDSDDEYDSKVKRWQAKIRKLVHEEMSKDEIKVGGLKK